MTTPDDSDASSKPGADRIGQLISDRYRIRALLGEGGMGAVYLAEHTMMKKRVALKLLHTAMAGNEEALARFKREADAASHIEHPNVAAATDFGQTEDGSFFLVLEYVDGVSLRAMLRRGPLGVGRSLHIARQIALALERAHELGIVHRDLKPENVMLLEKEDDPDFVKVLDFGIARVEPRMLTTEGQGTAGGGTPQEQQQQQQQQVLTRLGVLMGTPEYMAPEQALGEPVTPASDLYAVGLLLYEMLTGSHPFDVGGPSILASHLHAEVPDMGFRAPPNVDIPPEVEALTRRLLEKDAKARHASARALVDGIDEVTRTIRASASAVGAGGAAGVASAGAPSSDHMKVVIAPPLSAPAVVAPPPESTETEKREKRRIAPASTSSNVLRKSLDSIRDALDSFAKSPRVHAAISTARVKVEPLLRRLEVLARGRRFVVVVAAAVPFIIGVAIVTLVIARRPSSLTSGEGGIDESDAEAALEPAPARASADKVRAAAVKGPAALEALAEEFPGDPSVLRELAFAYDSVGRTSDALRTIRRMADAVPPKSKSVDASAGAAVVPRELVRVVVRAASKFDTADQAFELLEEVLGGDGVEGLLELAEDKEIPVATRARAERSVTKPSVRAKASPATILLLDLKAASSCESRREVLRRSGENADARALPSLKALKTTHGCGRRGRDDCHRCLRGEDTLERAIRAAEASRTE